MTDLEKLKKANQAYKLRLAQNAGFSSVAEYKTFLTTPKIKERKTRRITPVVSVKSKNRITIHVVDILDASGSMYGAKFENSKEGIMESLGDLRSNRDAKFTYSLVQFVDSSHVISPFFLSSLPSYISFCNANGSNTPLYYTVYETLERLEKIVGADKVLVKVYTDGIDNARPGFTKLCKDIIARLQSKNFTVTFVATDRDMPKIVRDLSLDESNTLSVTNDSAGFTEAFTRSRVATATYASGASAGEDVSRGFYKKVGTL